MSTAIKLGVNCLVVAGLTVASVLAFVALPEFTLKPLQWASQQFDRPGYLAFWFFETVLVWVVLGSAAAFCMLILKPRRVILYGLVSAATFIVIGQSWSLVTHATGYVRELVLVLTIPLLYWAFVHLARKSHNNSLNPDAPRRAG